MVNQSVWRRRLGAVEIGRRTIWLDSERTFNSSCQRRDEQLGFRYPMLPAHIRPLRSDLVLIGRAMPVQDELTGRVRGAIAL